jgi:hypothetical protein
MSGTGEKALNWTGRVKRVETVAGKAKEERDVAQALKESW